MKSTESKRPSSLPTRLKKMKLEMLNSSSKCLKNSIIGKSIPASRSTLATDNFHKEMKKYKESIHLILSSINQVKWRVIQDLRISLYRARFIKILNLIKLKEKKS